MADLNARQTFRPGVCAVQQDGRRTYSWENWLTENSRRLRPRTMRLSTFLAIPVPTVMDVQNMVSLQTPEAVQSPSWRVFLSPSWDVSPDGLAEAMILVLNLKCSKVLGPFPIHAREQHFLSPSYPLDRKPRSDSLVTSTARPDRSTGQFLMTLILRCPARHPWWRMVASLGLNTRLIQRLGH